MRKSEMMLGLIGLVVGLIPGGTAAASDAPDVWALLKELLLVPGVSGFEAPVADTIRDRLPTDLPIERDDMHNLWFTTGEGKPHLLFVAHTDELGLVVESITGRGTLKVSGRGGFFPHMYEGRAVDVHTRFGTRPGVVAPRAGYHRSRGEHKALQIEEIEIDLGVSGDAAAERLGAAVGDSITIRKTITELSDDLLAARGVDDRAGCAALLAAAHRIDWSGIRGVTVTFAWDVQEEIGLRGAARLAESLHPDYVFAVDTFVSSDTPLDEQRFARLPLGEGMVIRVIDSSSIAPRKAVRKIMAVAEAHGIPYQLGNTRGGNDGSVFVPAGAADIPLSWPGVHSHSFIEKIHRRDLDALTDMITALVRDFR